MRRDGDFELRNADKPDRLSDADARRVLARASEREAAWDTPNPWGVWEAGVSAARLREAAIEAGISAVAFDAALADLHGAARPARGRRRVWHAWAAVAAFATMLAGGVTVVRRSAERATPASVTPDKRTLAVSPACAAPAGMPVDRLRDLARRLHPETFGPASPNHAVVGLLFDAQCALLADGVMRREGDELTVDTTLARLFLERASRSIYSVRDCGGGGDRTFCRGNLGSSGV